MKDQIKIGEIVELGEGSWNIGRYKSKPGKLVEGRTSFKLELLIKDAPTLNKKFSVLKGQLHTSGNHVRLMSSYISKRTTTTKRGRVDHDIVVNSKIKLEHHSPIDRLSFKTIEARFPDKLQINDDPWNNVNLNSLYQHKGISTETTKAQIRKIYEGSDFYLFLKSKIIVQSKSVMSLEAERAEYLSMELKKERGVEHILSSFDKIRNLFSICSYFNQNLRLDLSHLYYGKAEDKQSDDPVMLNAKASRIFTNWLDSTNTYNGILYPLLKNFQEYFDRYLDLLTKKDYQYVIDVYLSHYLPSKQNHTVEMQFMTAVQLIEAVYNRTQEDVEDEVDRKIESFKCSCGNSYCKKCTRLTLRDLEAKIKIIKKTTLPDTNLYAGFDFDYGAITRTRNYHTHGKRSANGKLLDTGEMIRTSLKLEYMFLYSFLTALGYDSETLDHTLTSLNPFHGILIPSLKL